MASKNSVNQNNQAPFKGIKEAIKDSCVVGTLREFSMAQVVSYFIEAVASDNERTKDFKSLRQSSFQMYKDGHIQKLQVKIGYNTLLVQCDCLPEMRKDRVYKLLIRLHKTTADIQFAKCGCVAGKGPKASCKHVAAVCYALEDFSRTFLSGDQSEVSCTDKLMSWNQPRKRRLPPQLLSALDFSVECFDKKKRKREFKGRKSEDIVGQISKKDTNAVKRFQERLDAFQKKNPKLRLGFTAVLNNQPAIPRCNASIESIPMDIDSEDESENADSLVQKGVLVKERNNLTQEKRMELFTNTLEQSNSQLWFQERKTRITGSVCGKILNRNVSCYPASIIKSVLEKKSFETACTLMGKDQESLILTRYLLNQKSQEHADISIGSAGFLVDKELGWLGASPDAVVDDGPDGKGCAEVKAAVSMWNVSLNEAASKSGFCLHTNESGQLELKQKHVYYHQCQLQLYVGRDIFQWCDFVVATANDIFIQRLTLDRDWVETSIPELEAFYDSFILPNLLKH